MRSPTHVVAVTTVDELAVPKIHIVGTIRFGIPTRAPIQVVKAHIMHQNIRAGLGHDAIQNETTGPRSGRRTATAPRNRLPNRIIIHRGYYCRMIGTGLAIQSAHVPDVRVVHIIL